MEDGFDLLIRGGQLIDGSGAAARTADVGVRGAEVAAVGDLAGVSAREVVSAEGRIVCPGFIDMHSHSDLVILAQPDATSRIGQAITTEVVGNCGHSAAPRTDAFEAEFAAQRRGAPPEMDYRWHSVGEFLERVSAARPATNQAVLVGHGTVRVGAMGYADRPATAAELARMESLVAEAMADGAFGLSSGLIYAPGAYASTDEVAALATAAARAGGFYATHMRDEADGLFTALDEALEIGRRAGLPVQVSHLKAAGRRQHGHVAVAVERIEKARREGVDAAADFYPYEAGSTSLSALLPPWVLEGGVDRMVERLGDADVRRKIAREIDAGLTGWWNPVGAMGGDWTTVLVTRVGSDRNRLLQGRRIGELAAERDRDPVDMVADLLCEERGSVQIVIFMMDSRDVATVASVPWVMMGTDGSAVSPAAAERQLVHPRTYGTTARILRDYAGPGRAVTWEAAIHRMTALPAARLGLTDRGRLAAGMKADIAVLDPATLEDRATYARPHVLPTGVDLVVVNGSVALRGGAPTGARAGVVLRRTAA